MAGSPDLNCARSLASGTRFRGCRGSAVQTVDRAGISESASYRPQKMRSTGRGLGAGAKAGPREKLRGLLATRGYAEVAARRPAVARAQMLACHLTPMRTVQIRPIVAASVVVEG